MCGLYVVCQRWYYEKSTTSLICTSVFHAYPVHLPAEQMIENISHDAMLLQYMDESIPGT